MSDLSFLQELQRRNVFRVATVYAVGSFVVLQLADILLPALALADEDIRYVLGLLVAVFPFVVAFSWFYEVTPEGLKRTVDVEDDSSIARDTGRRIDRIAIVLLSLAVVALLARSIIVGAPDEAPSAVTTTDETKPPAEQVFAAIEEDTRPSLAVLPLVNMSSNAENEHFADGLTEELLNVLAQNANLRVAARTSSFYYKGRNENLKDVGAALGVDHILEGSVRRAGDRIRITVQLIKVADGFHLWSQTFDRELLDVFAVQDEISAEVASAMEVTLSPEDPRIAAARTTDHPEAYELYLRASEALYTREEPNVVRALDWFREASALDPNYGPPLLGIAEAAQVLQNNFATLELLEADGIAREALERAADLGFETAHYWALIGLSAQHLLERDPQRYEEAVAAFEKSLEMNDNSAIVYTWYSTLITEQPGVLSATERVMAAQRSRHLLERALALDPLNRVTHTNYLNDLWRAGEQDLFWTHAREQLERDPGYPGTYNTLAWGEFASGRLIAAAELYLAAPTDSPNFWPLISMLRFMQEDELALRVAARMPEASGEYAAIQSWIASERDSLEAVKARAEAMVTDQQLAPSAQRYADRLMREGEYDLLRRLVEHAFPTLLDEVPRTRSDQGLLAFYAKVLYYTGDVTRAREMAELSLVQNRGRPATGAGSRWVNDLWSYLVLGRNEAAIAEFEALEAAGFLGYWGMDLDVDPLLDPIRDDARVQAAVERMELALEEQREPVIALLTEQGLI